MFCFTAVLQKRATPPFGLFMKAWCKANPWQKGDKIADRGRAMGKAWAALSPTEKAKFGEVAKK